MLLRCAGAAFRDKCSILTARVLIPVLNRVSKSRYLTELRATPINTAPSSGETRPAVPTE